MPAFLRSCAFSTQLARNHFERQNLQYSRHFVGDTGVDEAGPVNESTSVAGHYTQLAHESNMALIELVPRPSGPGRLGEFYNVRKRLESSFWTLAQTCRISLLFLVIVPKVLPTSPAISLLAVIRRHRRHPALSSRPAMCIGLQRRLSRRLT